MSTGMGMAWGTNRTMDPIEAVMWRAESDPRMRSTIIGLELLDRAPDWERLRAAHEWGARMVPRFTQRVIEPPLGWGTPTWASDPNFDLDYHLRRVRLPGKGDWDELLRATAKAAETPFDKTRSPWEAILFEGLTGDKAAYMIKLHHSTSDGIGGIQLLNQLHSRSRKHNPDKPQPAPPPLEAPGLSSRLASQITSDAHGIAGAARGIGGPLGRLRHPRQSSREAAEFAASMQRMISPPAAESSPLLANRSLSRRLHALDVPFADLRGASKAAGGTLNDAYLAALLGAFGLYHERMGEPISTMPIAIPISTRSDDDEGGGNKFVAARLAAPVDIADPAERIRQVGELVRGARGEPALNSLGLAAPLLSRAPREVIAQIAGKMAAGNDLQATNVPGIREDVYLAGAKVKRLYGFAPVPGGASMISLASHGKQCCIGANTDSAAITNGTLFGECLRDGFKEVLTLNPEGGKVVLRG